MMWVRRSIRNFFTFYFGHYMEFGFAPVHERMFELLQDQSVKHIVAMVFRGGGKSSICTTAFPLWSILGEPQAKHILIVSRTLQQAQQHLDNIRIECENNPFLKRDFGEVFEKTTPWNTVSLSFSKVDAKITAVSAEQSIRGTRYGAHRPDLIILDDVEDIASVRTKESRNKLFDWFTGDLLPAGNEKTRLVAIGNNLHNDSLLNRLIDQVKKGRFKAEIIHQPIVCEDGSCAWPSRFPDETSLHEYHVSLPSERAWRQEMMLELLPPEDQIIKDEWVQYYDDLPNNITVSHYCAIGIDLAISTNSNADKTAMVRALVADRGSKMRLFILPHPENKQMSGAQSLNKAIELVEDSKSMGKVRVFVETVAYQRMFIDMLEDKGVREVHAYQPGSSNKEDRLKSISTMIESGEVLFPKAGAQELIDQMLGLGIERYDDLVDALTTLVLKAIELNKRYSRLRAASGNMSSITMPEDVQEIEEDNRRREIEERKKAINYWIYVRELHLKGEVPPLF